MIVKYLVFFLTLLSSSFSGLSQDEKVLFFDTTTDVSPSFKKSIPISKGYCSEIKKTADKNRCFVESLKRDLKNNQEHPLDAIFEKKSGSVIIDIHFGKYGTAQSCDIIEITDPVFAANAKTAAMKVTGYDADQKKKNQAKCTIRIEMKFSYEDWADSPRNKYEFYQTYFDENCMDPDSTQLLTCDSCSSEKFGIFKQHKISMLENIEKRLKEKGLNPSKTTGYIFTKYSIDSQGNFVPFPHIFENTTGIQDDQINAIISELPNTNSCESCDLSMHRLILYFDERGLLNPSKANNAQERMPVFIEKCKEIKDLEEQAKCTESQLLRFAAKHTEYPDIARENGFQGRVYVQFVIDKTGYVTNIEVLKGAHKSLNQAAINAIKSLPRLEPAIQRGLPVNLKYTLPLNFTLN